VFVVFSTQHRRERQPTRLWRWRRLEFLTVVEWYAVICVYCVTCDTDTLWTQNMSEWVTRVFMSCPTLNKIIILIIIGITRTMFMVLSLCLEHFESSPGSFDECSMKRQVTTDLWTKPTKSCHRPACSLHRLRQLGNYIHHRHLLLLLSSKSWYSFYRPTEGRRLSLPRWLFTYQDGVSARGQSPIQVLIGPGVERWLRPVLLDFCSLPHSLLAWVVWVSGTL